MEVSCPSCEEPVWVDPVMQDPEGHVRPRCSSCNSGFIIKVNAPALKVDGEIPEVELRFHPEGSREEGGNGERPVFYA